MSVNFKNPPRLDQYDNYENWEKTLKLWRLATEVPQAKQGTAVLFALTGKARDKVLELTEAQITADDGLDTILAELGKIYKKDTVDSAYEAFECFINFKREPSMNMSEYIIEFEKRYNKAAVHGFTLAKSCLGYFLLNQARLSEDHRKLVRATIANLELDEVKAKLKKVFGCNETASQVEEVSVKIEDINVAEDVLYGNIRPNFRSNNYNQVREGSSGYGQKPNRFGAQRYPSSSMTGVRKKVPGYQAVQTGDRKLLRCHICESTMHLSYNCPHKKTYVTECEEEDEDYTVVLYQSNLITEEDYKTFVVESASSAILDSGASGNVAGLVWFESYVDGLSNEEQEKVKYFDSFKTFKFGSGMVYQSQFRAEIPAYIGNKRVLISTDVVDTTVPLLLSKEAMKKAGTKINFMTDEVTMFNTVQKVNLTESGHYAIPLNKSAEILKKLETGNEVKINLVFQPNMNRKQMATKLHSQFGHPTRKNLVKVVKRAGMGADRELIQEVGSVRRNCKVCKEFTRPSPTPAVGMPHAERFNETVAMDLKFFEGKIILHAIDHLTRYSSAVVIKSKDPEVVIQGLIKCWISIFGPPGKFMVDNGGEFANSEFIELAESMNVRIVPTPAFSPWSNGLVERHNATLAEILHKVQAEGNRDIEIDLCWALQAKNSLDNVHGFSPAQLVFGQNPAVPTAINSNLPALESEFSSDVVTQNLLKMKTAREAFIQAESAERVKRALRHNIRPYSGQRFYTGDLVLYKRNDSRRWKGPGRVIGSESSNVLIKHGSSYVRVHSCRVLPAGEYEQSTKSLNGNEKKVTSITGRNKTDEKIDSGTDDSSNVDSQDEDSGNSDSETSSEKEEQKELVENQEDEDTMGQDIAGEASKKSVSKGSVVEYQDDKKNWKLGKVLSRAGKAKGKYGDVWNVQDMNNGRIEQWELNVKDDHWREHQGSGETHEIFLVSNETKEYKSEQLKAAKLAEVEKWIEEKVYDEVCDEGQERVSTTWVITEKLKDDRLTIKARLVAPGYEEDKAEIRSDSPTCMKNSVRMMLGIIAGKEWTIHSLDVKAAFLQGESIERELYLTPPLEFRKKGVIWKLNKVVYGLCDASRSWYLKVVSVLTELGMTVGSLEKAMFMFKTETLEGLVLIHVDDMLFAGTEKFHEKVMNPLKNMLKISREDSVTFKYLGMSLCQKKGQILLSQSEYVKGLQPVLLGNEAMKDKERFADKKEITIFRQAVGQLGWVSSVSKPEAAFGYCCLSIVQSKPQIKDFHMHRKVVKELQSREWQLIIGAVNMEDLRVCCFCDASFGSLTGGASQIGYIVFMYDGSGNAAPLTWVSKKAKRVARSSLAAETLAASEAADHAILMKKMLEETLDMDIPAVTVLVDNMSLYESVRGTNLLAEKRLLVEMASLREMQENRLISVEWVSTHQQLADSLTKAGANKQKLMEVLSSGKLDLVGIRSG